MTAAYLPVVIVHLPVVGLMFILAVTLLGLFFNDRRLTLIGCAFTVVCAVGTVIPALRRWNSSEGYWTRPP